MGVCPLAILLPSLRLLPGSVNATCGLIFIISRLTKKTQSRLQKTKETTRKTDAGRQISSFAREEGFAPCSLNGDASGNRGFRIVFKAIKRSD